MLHRSRNLGLLTLLLIGFCSGCGGQNSPPAGSTTAEYAQQSNDEMKKMYGAPKADTSAPSNASDMMKNMYNR